MGHQLLKLHNIPAFVIAMFSSAADNLYESVDNHPGSVRKCPAGPPPPPAEEPLYSKPNKKKNKKDKKDKEASKSPQPAL